MKRLLKHLKPYTKESILGPLGKLCEATLELIVPLVIAAIIDRGIGEGDTGYIWKMTGVLALLGAVGLTFSVFAQYFSAKAAVGFVTSVRHSLYSHIQTLSYNDIDKLGTSTMITRMTTDASRVQTGLNIALRLLLRSPFVVFGAMIMAFTIDVKAGLVFAIVIPALALIVFGIMLITMPMHKRVQGGVDKILGRTRASLRGARVIRAFGMEEDQKSKFVSENDSLTHHQTRAGHISALLNPLTFVIINLGIVFLIYTGAIRVDAGDLTQGQVIALYNYMSQILIELIKLAMMIITITKALASASRISSVFDIQSSQSFGDKEEGVESEFAVEFSDVALKYASAAENSIEGISFKARHGETVGIIGGTGAGKSSIVNLIPRFYDATSGEVRINGLPVKSYTKEALVSRIGVVPQKAVLFGGTLRDNLTFGKADATDEEIYSAVRVAQAEDVVLEKGGLDGQVEALGANLSGGQKQRLTIARALVGKPEILILDDSASALDFASLARVTSISQPSSQTSVRIVATLSLNCKTPPIVAKYRYLSPCFAFVTPTSRTVVSGM